MEYIERDPVLSIALPTVVGEWYLKGIADAYSGHWAAVPRGLAGEHYQKGYALGIASIRCEFFSQAIEWVPAASGGYLAAVADSTV